MGVLTGNP